MLQLIPLTLGALISSVSRRDCGKFVWGGEKQMGIFSPADVKKSTAFGFWSARLLLASHFIS